ncbi:MAG: hypothetical protein V9G19_18830 [Tetrasphaera sp.]
MTLAHPDRDRLAAASPSRPAAAVNALADPALVLLGGLIAVTAHAVPLPAAIGWTLLAVTFCIALPYAALLLLVRRGRVGDRHIVAREERRLPFAIAFVSTLAGLGILVSTGAPRPLVAVVAAGLVAFAAVIVLSTRSKASVHTGVAAAVVTALAIEFGPWLLVPGTAVVAVVGWARTRAGRHTAGQVWLGAGVAAAAVLLVYPAVR